MGGTKQMLQWHMGGTMYLGLVLGGLVGVRGLVW